MVDKGNVGGLGMVAVAVVSTGVVLASYHLIHRRLQSNLKLNSTIAAAEQRRHSSTKEKKVRFADGMAKDLLPDSDDLRRASAATGSKLQIRPTLRKVARSTHLAC